MTPHNEHIMLKLARAQQQEHILAAEALSRAAGLGPRRRVALAAVLVSLGGVVVIAAILMLAALT